MRGKIAVVTALTAGVVSVGSLSLGGQSVAIPATSEEPVAGTPVPSLPEEVEGGVIVDLADGDRFTVTTSRDLRTVWSSRYDAATRSWSATRVIVREKNLYCGRVDARGAGNAVAVIAECDTGGYSEDTAPTSSRALYSPDTVSWHASTLPGEAHEEPGISPSGNRAVWPLQVGAPRRCDVVQPVSPRAAVRLTTRHTSGWPSMLQKSTASGWRRTDPRWPARSLVVTGAGRWSHSSMTNRPAMSCAGAVPPSW